MFIAGPDQRVLRVNEAYCAMTGYAAVEMAGRCLPAFSLSPDGRDASANMWEAVATIGKWQGEIYTFRSDGGAYPARLTVTAVCNQSGHITHYVGTQADITAQKLAQDETLGWPIPTH